MAMHTDDNLTPIHDDTATADRKPTRDSESPRSVQAIPPPPMKGKISELRLKKNRMPLAVPDYGAIFVWGQGDASEIPRDVPPPSDLADLHPQLRDTVKPGRVA
jgi:hypothetical protein